MGKNLDEATVANFKKPIMTSFMTEAGPMMVDMREVVKRIGGQLNEDELDKGDVISIGGYRNAQGKLVPDYDSIKIERRKVDE